MNLFYYCLGASILVTIVALGVSAAPRIGAWVREAFERRGDE